MDSSLRRNKIRIVSVPPFFPIVIFQNHDIARGGGEGLDRMLVITKILDHIDALEVIVHAEARRNRAEDHTVGWKMTRQPQVRITLSICEMPEPIRQPATVD